MRKTASIACAFLLLGTIASAAAGIVTELPKTAIEKEYTFSGGMFTEFWGKVITFEEEMLPARMAVAGNTVYWHDPTYNGFDSYLVGTIGDDNVITFTFPQQLSSTLYANRMTKTSAEGDDLAYETVDEAGNYLSFTIADDGTISMNEGDVFGSTILGITSVAGAWKTSGIYEVTLVPFTDTVVTPPAGLNEETWIMTCETGTREVGVMQNATDFYVRGIWESNPTLWIAGKNNNGTITFASDSYVGVDVETGWRCFLYGSQEEKAYSESAGIYTINKPLDAFVIKYDDTRKCYSAECNLSICPGINNIGMPAFAPVKDIVLRPKAELTDFTPAMPNISKVEVYPQYPNQGWDYIDVYLADTNVDGQPLNTANISYRVLLDGVPYILDPEEFDGVDQAMEWIPFDFTCYDLENIGGTGRSVSIYNSDVRVYGVQEKYVDESGKEYLSAIAEYSLYGNGIDAAEASHIVAESYSDLAGREVETPASGIYIKRAILSDGTVKCSKVIIK